MNRLMETPLGIIAGNGRYPQILAERLVEAGKRLVVASFEGETVSSLLPHSLASHPVLGTKLDGAEVFRVGEVDRLFSFLATCGAKEFFLAGGIRRKGLWLRARPDRTALRILLRSGIRRDEPLLRGFADQGRRWGLEAGDPRGYLHGLLLKPGVVAGPDMASEIEPLIERAMKEAQRQATRGLGQAAVAWPGGARSETASGTDALIAMFAAGRHGQDAVLVKVPRPGQDLRFDMPTLGPDTIARAGRSGIRAVAGLAGATLLLDGEEAAELADKYGVTIWGMRPKPEA